MKTLRILFTILSAICVAGVLPLGAFLGFTWAIALGLSAFLFYLLMLYCKQAQEKNEPKTEETIKNDSANEQNETESEN